MSVARPRLGFMVSGRGSNMCAIIEQCRVGKLVAEPAVVISNNANATALEYACSYDLPTLYLSAKTPAQAKTVADEMTEALLSHAVDWVILAGYTQRIEGRLLQQFQDKIVNIHPSLLPKYGGKGMYGLHLHRAVLASGDAVTGVTVHLVNGDYDDGRVLAQTSLPVLANDTAESLAARVLQVEHQFYVDVLAQLFAGKWRDCSAVS